MAWEQELTPPVVEGLVRQLLLLRELEGRGLVRPLGVSVWLCGLQLLETHHRDHPELHGKRKDKRNKRNKKDTAPLPVSKWESWSKSGSWSDDDQL
jgi:hypothetical protein